MKTINKTKYSWIGLLAIALMIVGLIAQFVYGDMFSAGDQSFNFFASGDFAAGVFSAGTFAIGIFSAGIFSLGFFSIGIFNVGLFAVGIFVYGYRKKQYQKTIEA